MEKIALVVFSLALTLSIQLIAGQEAKAPTSSLKEAPTSSLNEEQAFYLGVGIALDQMAIAGLFDGKEVRNELGKVDFHHAFEEAKAKENNEKAVFVATFLNTMEQMLNARLLERGVYDKLFPGGGKTLTPQLEKALAKAFDEARPREEHNVDGKPKRDL